MMNSSRGPACGKESKPDLLTPGVDITSLRSPHSYLDKTEKSARVEQYYMTLSGTSMATPICAGDCALVLQAHPDHPPDDVKQLLLEGSEDRGLPPYVQGAGYLDAKKSVDQSDNTKGKQARKKGARATLHKYHSTFKWLNDHGLYGSFLDGTPYTSAIRIVTVRITTSHTIFTDP